MESPEDKVAGLKTFLSDLGAMVETMDADYHDRVLAITSHLPHLIAYTIVGTAVDLEQDLKNDVIPFSASGFRDLPELPLQILSCGEMCFSIIMRLFWRCCSDFQKI